MVLGKFDHDLTVLPHWESWLGFGTSSPFLAARFRLVNYYNLPSYIPIVGVMPRIISHCWYTQMVRSSFLEVTYLGQRPARGRPVSTEVPRLRVQVLFALLRLELRTETVEAGRGFPGGFPRASLWQLGGCNWYWWFGFFLMFSRWLIGYRC